MTDELRDEIRNALIKKLVRRSQEAQKDRCCLAPEWRNRLCQYHQGYEDGAEAALLALELPDAPEVDE